MNIRKPTDYTTLFTALDAAVAASEYLQEAYPAADGFSPRNVRRMRDFYRMYGDTPELLAAAMRLNWTQNVVIMEAELTMDERCWYIRKAAESGLSKTELLRMIERAEHSEIALGESVDTCYTVENDEFSEKNRYEEYPVYLPRQYLPQPHGRVRDEGLGEKGWAGVAIPYRVGSHQPRGDRQPGLSSGAAQAGGARDLLRRPRGAAAYQCRLRKIRSPDRYGQCEPAEYALHLRRRLCRQAAPPDGLHRPPPRCCRPVVHRRFRGHMAGCAGRMSRSTERGKTYVDFPQKCAIISIESCIIKTI